MRNKIVVKLNIVGDLTGEELASLYWTIQSSLFTHL